MSKHWLWLNTDTGKVLMLPDKKRCTKRRHKIKRLINAYKANKITKERLLQIVNAMKAHLAKGNAYKAIKEIDDMINKAIE